MARLAAVAGLALWAWAAPAREVTAAPRLLPDVGGPIEAAVVAVNSARRAALRNASLVTDIVNALPPSVRLDIVLNDPTAFTVARNPWPERVSFLELPGDNPITIWTQDPFLVLGGEGADPVLLASRDFERAGDALIAERLAAARGYALRRSDLYFEGGNVVADRHTVFIGANTIRHNAAEAGVSDREVARRFEEELGRRLVVVGPLPQPVGHIDMVLTPLGRGRVALADPAAGAGVVERALEDDPDSVEAFERRTEALFFGHPSIEALPGPDGKTITPPSLAGMTRELAGVSRAVAPVFEGMARGLEAQGYEVLRVPFLFGGPDSLALLEGRDEPFRATYPMLTYNNVLVETRDGADVVYLPRYGWPDMDDAAARAWGALGFAVRTVDGLATSAMYGGALRCSVKVLRRRGSPGTP